MIVVIIIIVINVLRPFHYVAKCVAQAALQISLLLPWSQVLGLQVCTATYDLLDLLPIC